MQISFRLGIFKKYHTDHGHNCHWSVHFFLILIVTYIMISSHYLMCHYLSIIFSSSNYDLSSNRGDHILQKLRQQSNKPGKRWNCWFLHICSRGGCFFTRPGIFHLKAIHSVCSVYLVNVAAINLIDSILYLTDWLTSAESTNRSIFHLFTMIFRRRFTNTAAYVMNILALSFHFVEANYQVFLLNRGITGVWCCYCIILSIRLIRMVFLVMFCSIHCWFVQFD